MALSVWLPMFWNVIDCGLSLLVEPTYVEEKLNDGACERFTSVTTPCVASLPVKISPALSTARLIGCTRLVMVDWTPLGVSSITWPRQGSATNTSCAASTATPYGHDSPVKGSVV